MREFLLAKKTDEALLRDCAAHGDRCAFEVIFERHERRFYRFLVTLTGDPTVAEDVSQACWLKLLESFSARPIYRPSASAKFTTFLFTLGRNYYIDRYVRRHEVSRTQSLDGTAMETRAAPEPPVDLVSCRRQMSERVLIAIKDLPLPQREVVSLWASGLDFDNIAKVAQAPRNTVRSRLRYGIERLRTSFVRDGLLDADANGRHGTARGSNGAGTAPGSELALGEGRLGAGVEST